MWTEFGGLNLRTKLTTEKSSRIRTHLESLLLLLSPTLCDPIDGSPAGSPVPGILQARTLEWVAISFSSAWKWKVKVKSLSRVRLLATPWTAAHQAPPSTGFSRQEYWSGVPLPSPIFQTTMTKMRLNSVIQTVSLLLSCHFYSHYSAVGQVFEPCGPGWTLSLTSWVSWKNISSLAMFHPSLWYIIIFKSQSQWQVCVEQIIL